MKKISYRALKLRTLRIGESAAEGSAQYQCSGAHDAVGAIDEAIKRLTKAFNKEIVCIDTWRQIFIDESDAREFLADLRGLGDLYRIDDRTHLAFCRAGSDMPLNTHEQMAFQLGGEPPESWMQPKKLLVQLCDTPFTLH